MTDSTPNIMPPAIKGMPSNFGHAPPPPLRVIHVSSVAELDAALADARPGDEIALADGRYTGNVVISVTGTADAPIVISGRRAAVIDGGDWGIKGYAVHLDRCAHTWLRGFTVTNAQKGVMVDRSDHVVIDALEVLLIGHEAVHLRSHTVDSVVMRCDIHDAGLDIEAFGEGIYIGTAVSNWERYTSGEPDRSDRNQVIGNRIWATRAECIDIKEGTEGGLIEGNTLDGSAMTVAGAWVNVKGNGYLVRGNRGESSPEDGFQTHVIDDMEWGRDNVFEGNTAIVRGSGYGFAITRPEETGNIVRCDNVVEDAAAGFTNMPGGCTD